jgi:hypothetical protein
VARSALYPSVDTSLCKQGVCCTKYSAEVQQRPLTAASEHCHRHTELPAMTDKRPEAPLVRDEEAAGSNPATPTEKFQVNGMIARCDDHAIDHLLAVRWRDRTPSPARAEEGWQRMPS